MRGYQKLWFQTITLLSYFLFTPCLTWTPNALRVGRSSSSTRLNFFGRNKKHEPDEDHTRYDEFVEFLLQKQEEIIAQIEGMEEHLSGAKFTKDSWGLCVPNEKSNSGGITRVIQGGEIVEKGACSLTVIDQGVLTAERAATIRGRQDVDIQAGDRYAAAALSIVLHTKSPLVPTFRSDVRVFWVEASSKNHAWFGGGADLTPYYLESDDIRFFHFMYKDLCDQHFGNDPEWSYEAMKKECDKYFYLPARSEHRGTGGIFWDDMPVHNDTMAFTKAVVNTWMPSWLPIVERRHRRPYTDEQKHWQLLRRGRYLEFNLLYDRGVRFGLSQANPRVEGVMVSAPPMVAYEYKHQVEPGSPEEELMKVLKEPIDWV